MGLRFFSPLRVVLSSHPVLRPVLFSSALGCPYVYLSPGLPGRQQKSPASRSPAGRQPGHQVARSPGRQWSPVVAS
eukprot:7051975-Prymnesium_polylepis.1